MKKIQYKHYLSLILIFCLSLGVSSCGVYYDEAYGYDEEEIIEQVNGDRMELIFSVRLSSPLSYYENDIEFDLITPSYRRVSRFGDSSRCIYDSASNFLHLYDNMMTISCQPAELGMYELEIRSNLNQIESVRVNIDQKYYGFSPSILESNDMLVNPQEVLVYPVYIH